MWSKKPNHISPWRTCPPPGCISSWAAESSPTPFSPALLRSLHSCPAETHPREKPRENIGMDVCFKSHLAALETHMKQPVILTCCCRAHTAHPVIHFLLAKLAGYRHGADSCGFSQVSPYTTGHVNAWKKSAVCPDHSVTWILMLMAQLGNSLSLSSAYADRPLADICKHLPFCPSTSWDN